jgi:hypothetical protein
MIQVTITVMVDEATLIIELARVLANKIQEGDYKVVDTHKVF